MAKTQDDVSKELDLENATIADVANRVSADMQALKDQIAAGAAPADLQPLFDKVDANIAALKNVDAPAAPTARHKK